MTLDWQDGARPPERSPYEPPVRVRSELLWRLALLLYREHVHPPGERRCRCCRQPWPCSGRRMAELGLRRAWSRG